MRSLSTRAVLLLLGVMAGCWNGPDRSDAYLVKDIRPGPASGLPYSERGSEFTLHALGDTLYLRASDFESGPALWRSDGTEEGTELVMDLRPEDAVDPFNGAPARLGNALYFFASDRKEHGLWKLEQGAAAPVLVKSLPLSVAHVTYDLKVFGDHLSFTRSTPELGSEPWVSDGSAEGTRPLKDIAAGGWGSLPSGYCAPAGPLYYFTASDASSNQGLWRSDGTEAGASLVMPLGSDTDGASWYPFVAGDELYLERVERVEDEPGNYNYQYQVWRSDGTEAGTRLLLDLPWTSRTSLAGVVGALDGALVFGTREQGNGALGPLQLWSLRGVSERTLLATESTTSGLRGLTSLGERLLFFGPGKSGGGGLWSTDGSPAGTRHLADVHRDGLSNAYAAIDGLLIFGGEDAEHGSEVWRSDGTPEGTFLIKDVRPGVGGSDPSHFTRAGDTLFFRASGTLDGPGHELWAIPMAKVLAPNARALQR